MPPCRTLMWLSTHVPDIPEFGSEYQVYAINASDDMPLAPPSCAGTRVGVADLRRVAGLTDAPRTGRPRTINDQKVTDLINKTLREKPENATHWSTKLTAKEAGLSAMSVSRIWRACT